MSRLPKISSTDLMAKFIEGMRSKTLPSEWSDSRGWTSFIHSLMREVGNGLGYAVRDKFTLGEFLGLDQAWRTGDGVGATTYLAMESENTEKVKRLIADEFQKLIDVKAEIKVLVYYPDKVDQANHLQVLKRAVDEGNTTESESYIIVMIDSDATRADGFKRYSSGTITAFELVRDRVPVKLVDVPFNVLGGVKDYERPSPGKLQQRESPDFKTTAAIRDQFLNPLYIEIGRINRALETQTLPYRQYGSEEWMKFKEDSRFRLMDGKLRNDLSQFYETLARISELSRLLIRAADEGLLNSVREHFGEDIQMCSWNVIGYKKEVAQGSLSLQPVEAVINGRDLIEHASILYSPMDTYQIQAGLQRKGSNEVPWRSIDANLMKLIFARAAREISESEITKEAREKELWGKREGSRLHEELGKILDKSFQA